MAKIVGATSVKTIGKITDIRGMCTYIFSDTLEGINTIKTIYQNGSIPLAEVLASLFIEGVSMDAVIHMHSVLKTDINVCGVSVTEHQQEGAKKCRFRVSLTNGTELFIPAVSGNEAMNIAIQKHHVIYDDIDKVSLF